MKSLNQIIHKLTKEQFNVLKSFCAYSNNLYNYTLYIIKQYYFETNKYIGFKQLYHEVKNNENYKILPSQCAQQIIKLVDKNFRSFFALLKRKNKGQYNDKINIPKYKEKGNLFNLIYTNQMAHIRNDKIYLNLSVEYRRQNPNALNLHIPFTYQIDGEIKQIIIKPINNGQFFRMIIHYEENKKETDHDLNQNSYLGIDLGLDNLASCVNSSSGHSFIMNGRSLKSYNRWYNKKKAERQSILKKINNKNWSKYLTILELNRSNYIDNYFNQCINHIVKYCLKNKISNIIIGYNKTWKKNINLGKINNQKFVQIPHRLFKQKLEHKCDEYGINFIQIEESYTSKCSFIDKERLGKREIYMGKRIKRGLFRTFKNILINTDINGAGNIVRKVIGNVVYDQPIVGLMLNPVKINFLTKTT